MPHSADPNAGPRRLAAEVTRPNQRQRLVAWGALAVALAFYAAAVMRLDLRQSRFLGLDPSPDGAEYFAGAVSLIDKGAYAIEIGDRQLPPRYPFGYSAVIAAVLAVAPRQDWVLVPFLVNRWLGLGMLIGVFAFMRRRDGPVCAAAAALLLATLPAFLVLARSPMSELVGASLLLAACACLELAASEPRPALALLGAAFLGAAACVRLSLAFFAPVLLLAGWSVRVPSWPRRIALIGACGAVATVCFAPLLLYQWRTLGGALISGYDYWVPGALSPPRWGNIAMHLRDAWEEAALTRGSYRVADYFGAGAYVTPALLLLAVTAAVRAMRSARGAIFVGASLIYFFGVGSTLLVPDFRLWFPILLFAVVAAARLAGQWTSFRSPGRILLLLLMASSVAGFPARSGNPHLRFVPHTLQILPLRRWYGASHQYRAAMAFADLHGSGPALVLSPINPVYLNALLPPAIDAIPDGPNHDYRFSPRFRFGMAEIDKAEREAVAHGHPVFHLVPGAAPGGQAAPQGFVWRRLADRPAAIDLLVPSPGASWQRE